MPIQQLHKQSDLEKRLRLLRQQVYGKGHAKISESHSVRQSQKMYQSDITYLNEDLTRISILATLAIGVQIILFTLTKNHILNLNLI